jgi:hypothetical protein
MGKYFELNKSVRITNAAPIDGDRYLADTIADRDKLITDGRAFNGLQVFVISNSTVYLAIDVTDPDMSVAWEKLGGSSYTHKQSTANTQWTVNHNLGKKPSIHIVDESNTEVIGEITYIDDTQVVLSFNIAIKGEAYCN